jgi:hypothetical protein
MKIPSRHQAQAYLVEASYMNPGLWVDHTRQVAETGWIIANHHPDLDPDSSFVLGLLHDIGRREGVFGMRHITDGYKFLLNEGYPDAARICLTHSYPIPKVMAGASQWDGTSDEKEFVAEYLAKEPYSLYDKLIQLCDSICLPSGPVLMEKRMVDVALRYGFNEFTIQKWQAFFLILKGFEKSIGKSVYGILPGIVNNTFGRHL